MWKSSILLFLSPICGVISKLHACRYISRWTCFYFLFMLLSGVLIMRTPSVGSDSYIMVNIYMTESSPFMLTAPVYHVYSCFLYSILPFPQAILICNGLITMLCFFYFIRKFSDDVYLSIYLFVSLGFYSQCFNIMRQMLALAIFLVALSLIYSKRYKLGAILAVLSLGIHITVIIMFPLLLVFYKKRINSGLLLSSICLLILSILLRDTLLDCIAWFVVRFFPPYIMYINGGSVGFGYEGQGRIIWLYIFYAVLILGLYYITTLSRYYTYNAKARLFMLPVSICVAIGCLGVNNPLLSRLSIYYQVFIIILIPITLQYFKIVSRRLLYVCVILVTTLPFYIMWKFLL